MATIDFPLTIRELTKMRKDGDDVSLFCSYASIICLVSFITFLAVYYLSSCAIFKVISIISMALGPIFLLVVYIYRPIFLSDDTRKQKALDKIRRKKYEALVKLEGQDYEEALKELKPDEREGYASYLDELLDKNIK